MAKEPGPKSSHRDKQNVSYSGNGLHVTSCRCIKGRKQRPTVSWISVFEPASFDQRKNEKPHFLSRDKHRSKPHFGRRAILKVINSIRNRAGMETFGLLIPGPRNANGAPVMRPTFPTRHLVRPILSIAHQMSGLDMAAYHRGDDGEDDDDDDMNEVLGVDSDIHWDVSDDASEWEDIGPLVSDICVDKICGGVDNAEDEEKISERLERQRDEDRAVCIALQQRDGRGSDDWEVISPLQEISEQQHVVSATNSKPPSFPQLPVEKESRSR